jgi:hypothetical protein
MQSTHNALQTHCDQLSKEYPELEIYLTGDILSNKDETVFGVEFTFKYMNEKNILHSLSVFKVSITKQEAIRWEQYLRENNCLYNEKKAIPGNKDYESVGWQPMRKFLMSNRLNVINSLLTE